MLLVGGGIYIHNIEQLHHLFAHWPMLSGELVVGLVVGMLVLGIEKGVHALIGRS
jgi:predicted DNA repair protein MutK